MLNRIRRPDMAVQLRRIGVMLKANRQAEAEARAAGLPELAQAYRYEALGIRAAARMLF